MSIPVLGVPLINRGDLLIRLLRSIDFPVEQLVIINNGSCPKVAQYLDDMRRTQMRVCGFAPGLFVIYEPPNNLGVAGSWNLIMREHPAPWWLIVGNDIQFSRGDLAKFDSFVREGEVDMAFGNQGYSAFAITPKAIGLAGTFDANFHPAYLEDSDYTRRCKLTGVRTAIVPDTHMMHGEPPMWGSSTIHSDARFRTANGVTQANGHLFYSRKWGGAPGKETFDHPFNDPEWPVNKWELDEELRAANVW